MPAAVLEPRAFTFTEDPQTAHCDLRVQAQTMGRTLARLEAAAHELEKEVLDSSAVDTDRLRPELKTVVRELAQRDRTAVSDAIVAAADQGHQAPPANGHLV